MKKKTGIWIAAASAAISLYGLLLVGLPPEVPEQLGYQSETEAAEQTEHIDSAESMAVQKPYRFVIKILPSMEAMVRPFSLRQALTQQILRNRC